MQEQDLRISSEPMAAEADANHVRDMLSLFNVAKTGHDYWRPVRVFVRDSTGFIRGGLTGDIWGGWLHVSTLWMEEPLRGIGLGKRLMETAEAEARAFGARYAHLDSHSFQAPGFYEKLGYAEFGRLEDAPLGHTQHFFWKRL